MTHPLGVSWMISFPKHPKLAFVFIRARGQAYGWLLGHLPVHFASHILFSPQPYVFIWV